MATDETFVIVGASLAGAKAAQTLREEGFAGRLILIGDETERPYERPPLSKGYLLGKEEREKIYVHEEKWYADNAVELLLGRRVTALDRDRHQVQLDRGEAIPYTKALLTPGATPRRLQVPGADYEGVLYLRRVEDSERLRDTIAGGDKRVVVVGAGWIGLETAAAAREYGCEVTIVEPQAAPLLGPLGKEMGGFFGDVHREHGVELRLGRQVTELRDRGGGVADVVMDDGTSLPADAVIVGVGVRPNVELAEQAGLAVDDGVLVDQSLRTEDPDVFAAGDVARAFNPLYGERIRVEHWANALNSGPAAGRAMLGQQVVYDRVPYFYTDQYDLGMEFSGWFPPGSYDEVVTRGDVAAKAFYAFWLTEGRVVAGMHVNLWDDGIGPAQDLIRSGSQVDRHRLADATVPLAEVTAR
jgi:3-phenylpropionate/trans-cinnamate dioxygenase ferredoxin reductase subunit